MRFATILAATFVAAGCSRTPPAPTFTKDVAPILFTQCASCHRPGEVAPFSLLSYADAQQHATQIARETRERHMPPWLPERGDVPIVGERRLSEEQIAVLGQWAKAGAPEGNRADLPSAPVFPDGWQLGHPDAVVTPPQPFMLQPTKDDVYRNLVVRTALPSDVFVRAVEFKTNGAPIHHAVIRVDSTQGSRRRDGEDGQPGFDGMGWDTVQDPDGHFVGWAPGRGPIVAPDGMPWRLDRGADLVIELHVVPTRKALRIQPTVALFLSATPPKQTPLTVKMGSRLIDIPAGKPDYVVTDSYELPVPVDLLGVYPHAHYLARDMDVTAALPDGTTKRLLHIPQWSFHWQQDYRYVTPIALPRGTRLVMKYTYDNSAGNEENPHEPPVRVTVGPRSTDEMAELGLQVLTASLADSAALVQSFADRDALANVALGEMRVRESPDNAEYRAYLGGSLVEVGRFAEALPHLEAAVRLDDRSAEAHSDLGNALMMTGRLPEALGHFRRAVTLAPRNGVMQFNLGNALKESGQPDAAAAAYERSLALNPDFADARVNLAALLLSRGRAREALALMERAVALRPNSAVIRTDYGSALAASGRFADALREFRRALALRPDYGPALDSVARLERMGVR